MEALGKQRSVSRLQEMCAWFLTEAGVLHSGHWEPYSFFSSAWPLQGSSSSIAAFVGRYRLAKYLNTQTGLGVGSIQRSVGHCICKAF